jgi:hypothetical protein
MILENQRYINFLEVYFRRDLFLELNSEKNNMNL